MLHLERRDRLGEVIRRGVLKLQCDEHTRTRIEVHLGQAVAVAKANPATIIITIQAIRVDRDTDRRLQVLDSPLHHKQETRSNQFTLRSLWLST